MNLGAPDDLEVDDAKIRDYLLDPGHPQNGGKSGFFVLHGFSRSSWQDLAEALRTHGASGPVVGVVANPYGRKLLVEAPLETPSGRRPWVRTVWFVGEEYPRPRLVTAYPLPEKGSDDDP